MMISISFWVIILLFEQVLAIPLSAPQLLQASSSAIGLSQQLVEVGLKTGIGALSEGNASTIPASSDFQGTEKMTVLMVDQEQYANKTNFQGIQYPIIVTNSEGQIGDFFSRPFFANGKESRYQIKGSVSKIPFLLQPKIPISACLDSTRGSGGSVGKTISFTFTSGVSATLGLAGALTDFITLSTTYGISQSIELDFGVSCSADAGESVQIFLAPWAIDASTSYRVVDFGAKSTSDDETTTAAADGWSDFFSSEWGVNVPPESYCYTRSSMDEACNIPNLDQVSVDRTTHIKGSSFVRPL